MNHGNTFAPVFLKYSSKKKQPSPPYPGPPLQVRVPGLIFIIDGIPIHVKDSLANSPKQLLKKSAAFQGASANPANLATFSSASGWLRYSYPLYSHQKKKKDYQPLVVSTKSQ
jgi:hypothetical protein